MDLRKGLTAGIAKANETLATAQKSWRDESLKAREEAVSIREAAVREREAKVSANLARITDLESRRRFRRIKYLLFGITGAALGGFTGLIIGSAGAPDTESIDGALTGATAQTVDAPNGDEADGAATGSDAALEAALSQSSDYGTYGAAFLRASTSLIADGRCEVSDFVESGGWIKSATTYSTEPVYFAYCGDHASVHGRIYVNAETGDIFK